MFLISTEGKTPQKISEEAKIAYQKYKQVETEQSKIADKKKT
jgi:predicted RNase H-like HicB family nuclease